MKRTLAAAALMPAVLLGCTQPVGPTVPDGTASARGGDDGDPAVTVTAEPDPGEEAPPPMGGGTTGAATSSGTLASICVGAATLPKARPHKATCCYPAKDQLARPIRATYPALRSCYLARSRTDAAGRVVFQLRIEQDGTIRRVCSTGATTLDDEAAVRCMLAEVKKVRYPAQTDAEADLCGLVTMSYPVVFEP